MSSAQATHYYCAPHAGIEVVLPFCLEANPLRPSSGVDRTSDLRPAQRRGFAMPPRKGPAKEPKPDTGVLAKPLKIKAKAPEGKAAAAGQSAEKKISPAKPRDQVAELKELEERRRQMKEQLRQVEAQVRGSRHAYVAPCAAHGGHAMPCMYCYCYYVPVHGCATMQDVEWKVCIFTMHAFVLLLSLLCYYYYYYPLEERGAMPDAKNTERRPVGRSMHAACIKGQSYPRYIL